MEKETIYIIAAILIILGGLYFVLQWKKLSSGQGIQTRPQHQPIVPSTGATPNPPVQQNTTGTRTQNQHLNSFIEFVKIHWVISLFFAIISLYLISFVIKWTAPTMVSNFTNTAQSTAYEVKNDWNKTKREDDKETGDYIPDEISGGITKTISEKKILYNFTITKDSKTKELEVPIYSGYNFFLPTTITASSGDLIEKLVPKDNSAPELKPGKWRLSCQKYFHEHPTEQQVSGWIEFITK